ncbi:MAG: LysR family transcriptional regulator, partial [Clostridia bacterium]|nr:LysR family transcriptional regulator [Clostridia bacterium]
LHFGRASKRLNICQPPLSQQIRRLEEEIGVQLLYRNRRNVELTPAGKAFLAEARRIVSLSEEAMLRALKVSKGESGRLDIGFIGSANYSVLPTVVREFRKRYQNVDLYLAEMNTSPQLDALRSGQIQVGFLRPPAGVESIGVFTETVFREPLVIAMPTSHQYAKENSLKLRLLAKDPFIMIPRQHGPGFFDYVISVCLQEGFSPSIVLEASQFHTIIGLVAAGLGIAIVPASMSKSQFEGVVFKRIDGQVETELKVAWLKDKLSPIVKNFLDVVREVCAGSVGY